MVPFGAEGAADRAARAFAQAMRGIASLEVENLPGSGGVRGLERANALANAGEATLLLGTPTTHVLLPARVRIAPDRSFAPLLGLGSAPNVLLVPRALGIRELSQLVARARRERLAYASAGEGQTIHVCSAYFCRLAGIEMIHRAYDGGSATAYADFTAGRVHMYFDSLLGCRERIASGEAVPLAVSSVRRSGVLPHVPTLAECGFPQHALDVWLGVFAAHREVEIGPVVEDAALLQRLHRLGLQGPILGRDAFAREVADSRAAWLAALAATP